MSVRYDVVVETIEKIFSTLEEQGDGHCGLRLTISGSKNLYRVATNVQGEKSLTYIAQFKYNVFFFGCNKTL
jgi:hypothetical protein